MSEVFRIHKTKDFTVMSNHHLRNARLTLRAKGLLSLMLSLPPSWDYSLAGLAKISREGTSAISAALKELAHDYTPERIDELIHIMTDAYCSTQPVLRIGNEDIPIAVVKSRIMKLNMKHIRYVLYALSQTKTKVHNIKSYLLTCLYNAPATISHFYQAAVSHDSYHSPPEVSQTNVPTGT